MARPAKPKLQVTKNYRMFERSTDNRCVDARKHKRLRQSIRKYGFLPCFPIGVIRVDGKLIVKDGQHRLMFAEQLGEPVYYVVVNNDFDIALVNDTQKTWAPSDYAEMHADNGNEHYREGLEFAETYRLPLGTAFALLAGHTSYSNIQRAFKDGEFEVCDRDYAASVAQLYNAMIELSPDVKNQRLLLACMAVCRLEDFDPKRLISGAKRCQEKLISYSTREAYLDMIEEIYNYGRKRLSSVAIPARQAMKERSVVHTNGHN